MVAAQEDQIRNLRFLMCRAGRPDPGPCSSAFSPESPVPRGGSRVDAYGVDVPSALGSGYATTGTLDPKPYIIYIYKPVYIYIYMCIYIYREREREQLNGPSACSQLLSSVKDEVKKH